jgi:hypothetical protein
VPQIADERIDNAVLTKDLTARSRVIARGRGIRDLERLVREYGGKPSRWTKRSSPAIAIEGLLYEYHWYEHHGIGRFEVKRKKVKQS